MRMPIVWTYTHTHTHTLTPFDVIDQRTSAMMTLELAAEVSCKNIRREGKRGKKRVRVLQW